MCGNQNSTTSGSLLPMASLIKRLLDLGESIENHISHAYGLEEGELIDNWLLDEKIDTINLDSYKVGYFHTVVILSRSHYM